MGDLGKTIVAIGFAKIAQMQKIAQPGHTGYDEEGSRKTHLSNECIFDSPQLDVLEKLFYKKYFFYYFTSPIPSVV